MAFVNRQRDNRPPQVIIQTSMACVTLYKGGENNKNCVFNNVRKMTDSWHLMMLLGDAMLLAF